MKQQDIWNRVNRTLIDYIVPAIIVVGVTIVVFMKVLIISYPKSDTENTFYSLSDGIKNYYEFKAAWKPRLFSNAGAAFTAYVSNWLLAKMDIPMVKRPLELTVGLWTAGWFFLMSSAFVVFFKKRALFYVFGAFAALSFGYMARLRMAVRVYPWDMPALFFFALFVLFFVHKKYWWIFVLVPLCTGFKETGMILGLSFLFADLPWKQRIGMMMGSLALAFGVKVGIDLYTHGLLFFTMETRMGGEESAGLYFYNNMWIFKGLLPYFVNAGTLLAFLILPITNKNVLHLKLLAVPFILGILLFGVAEEYRIWFEMIPFALYALDMVVYGDPLSSRGTASPA